MSVGSTPSSSRRVDGVFLHRWERDRTYAADVVLNCSKLSWLEGHVSPFLSRYRLETRKAVGLPGLAHALGDAMIQQNAP